jgi:pimeloyl-ACP methyl ester carboxylesterase
MIPTRKARRAIAVLLLIGVPVACSSTPSTSGPSETTVDAGTVRLHVRSTGGSGSSRTLVMVHGGPGLSLESLANLEVLAGPARRVVSYDQRGAGRSTAPTDGDYGLDAQLDDLERVRVATGAPQIDLLGQSWGGLLAAAYAARRPERVRSLVLLDAPPLDWAAYLEGQRRFSAREQELRAQGRVPAVLPTDDGDSCLPSLTARLPVYIAHADGPVPAFSTTCRASTSRATLVAFQQPAVQAEIVTLADALAAYRGRALVIMGDRDPFGTAWLDRCVALLRGAVVEQLVVADSGHLTSLEQPSVVVPKLQGWLAVVG